MNAKVIIGLVVLLILGVIAVGVVSCGGDDDDKSDSGTTSQKSGGGDDDGDGDSAPALKTIAVKRGTGAHATASAAGFAEKPKELWMRVSAAPKQPVTGSWNVTCSGGKIEMDTFKATPPYLQELRLPEKNAKSCVAGASAQLSGEGRLKVAILRDR